MGRGCAKYQVTLYQTCYPINRSMDDLTASYYRANAVNFFEDTVSIDMAPLYDRFLTLIPAGGYILDAGCGSGRDARFFLDRGYRVTAFDASAELVTLATEHTGIPVSVLRFQDLNCKQRFDGIWACASLLHVPAPELADSVHRLSDALKPAGILYASFKYGQGECEQHGRRFTDLDEQGLALLLDEASGLEELDTWITSDRRPGRADERWLNTLLRKTEEPWSKD